jgi:hypothetical protein
MAVAVTAYQRPHSTEFERAQQQELARRDAQQAK